MKSLVFFALLALGLSPTLFAQLRIHRIDELGEHSKSSPRFDHAEARAEGKIVFLELAAKHGWIFTQSSDSAIFTDEGLKDIDVIVFDNNTGILFNEKERFAFENWVRSGGGIVGIHGVTHAHKGVDENNEAEWPFWYGLWTVLHKSGPKQGPSGRRGYPDEVHMCQGIDHRWTTIVPENWVFNEVEWYFWNYHNNFEKVTKIATADVKTNQPELPEYYPVTWCHEYEGGRAWYTNMGHYAANYRQPEFIQHVLDGIAWAAEKK